MEETTTLLSEEEKDILQEIMNIAFGQAAADLAEIINIYVVLNVPYIQVLRAIDMPEYLHNELAGHEVISMVEQHFWGDFKGSAYLIFPSGAGKELVSIMGEGVGESGFDSASFDGMEKETLMEVGNILIGACVGKVAELLDDRVTYSPPRVAIENFAIKSIPAEIFDLHSSAIVLKTVFNFNERDVSGFLFLVTKQDSINWLKNSLVTFMEKYE
nr:chemotaxis protein CheC [Desulfobulbaceae bacterium]